MFNPLFNKPLNTEDLVLNGLSVISKRSAFNFLERAVERGSALIANDFRQSVYRKLF